MASPFPMKVSKNRENLIPAAKDGTLRVLKAGIKANAEQFVVTSSIAAMFRKPIDQILIHLVKMIGRMKIGLKELMIIFYLKQLLKKQLGN